jgi:uroporphyrin-III C-methyltransferase
MEMSVSSRFRVDPQTAPWAALVGAGPGDAGLLTRRGAELLAAADVVLHDWLVGPDVLALTRPGCRLVDVGKAKGRGCRQDEIDRLLIFYYRAACRVVRLKGGDPFVFGRGIEEVRAAGEAGFDVEVVPGVSSALAAPELAGIAVTERGRSAQVTIVSGHRVDGDNDWAALARTSGTLVVLMAATTGPSIAARLIAAGMGARTPVAVVAAAGCDDQAIGRGDLASLARRSADLPSPCVIVIGDVASARFASAERLTIGVLADANRSLD